MLRRSLLQWMFAAVLPAKAGARQSLRGKLIPAGKPVLALEGGHSVPLTGSKETMMILADHRLKGADFEVVGEPDSGRFRVGPLHEKSMFVYKDGKRLMISYWCEVCSIRTYTPGICMCCQEETAVDLKERFE